MYTIDKGLAVPALARSRSAGPMKYPWADMEHGDSFFVPLPKKSSRDDAVIARKRVVSAGRSWCKRNRPEARVISRALTEDNTHGIRIWMLVDGGGVDVLEEDQEADPGGGHPAAGPPQEGTEEALQPA